GARRGAAPAEGRRRRPPQRARREGAAGQEARRDRRRGNGRGRGYEDGSEADPSPTLGAQLDSELLADRVGNCPAQWRDVLVGQRRLGGTESDPEGERALPFADLRAAVLIKSGHVA